MGYGIWNRGMHGNPTAPYETTISDLSEEKRLTATCQLHFLVSATASC